MLELLIEPEVATETLTLSCLCGAEINLELSENEIESEAISAELDNNGWVESRGDYLCPTCQQTDEQFQRDEALGQKIEERRQRHLGL